MSKKPLQIKIKLKAKVREFIISWAINARILLIWVLKITIIYLNKETWAVPIRKTALLFPTYPANKLVLVQHIEMPLINQKMLHSSKNRKKNNNNMKIKKIWSKILKITQKMNPWTQQWLKKI